MRAMSLFLTNCNQIYTLVVKRTNGHFNQIKPYFLSLMSGSFMLEVNCLDALNPFGSYARVLQYLESSRKATRMQEMVCENIAHPI